MAKREHSGAMLESRSDRVFNFFNVILMIIILAIIIYPLWFIIIASVSDSAQVTNGNVLLWPKGFHLDAYRKVFADSRIMTGYRNTLFYTLFGTFLNVLATLMLAYPLSRRDLAGRNVIMGILSVTMFFGGGLIPTYLVYKQLGILNTVWVMVLPGLVSVYNCILMRTFIQGLPFELQEAAMIDGCGPIRTFFLVVFPMLKPTIVSVGILETMWLWNDYLLPYLVLDGKKYTTIPILIQYFRGSYGKVEMGPMMACIVLTIIPIIIVYIAGQKHIIKGVAAGAVKG